LKNAGQKQHALNPTDEDTLESLIATMNSAAADRILAPALSDREVNLAVLLATRWTYKDRLPGLDLLRILAADPTVADRTFGAASDQTLVDLVLKAAFEPDTAGTPVNENAVMMALRLVANLFVSESGRPVAVSGAEKVLHAVETVVGEHRAAIGLHNRNVGIALTTVVFNYMELLYQSSRAKPGTKAAAPPEVETLTLMANVLQTLLREQTDSEVSYRALMALGMALASPELIDGLKTLGVEESIQQTVKKASEQRVKDVGAEALAMLR
jgi:phospholipase A-2-activating protein